MFYLSYQEILLLLYDDVIEAYASTVNSIIFHEAQKKMKKEENRVFILLYIFLWFLSVFIEECFLLPFQASLKERKLGKEEFNSVH